MDSAAFIAQRREEFFRVDEELRPSVEDALRRYADGDADWADDLIDDASVLWLETYLAEAPNANPEGPRYVAFRESLGESLGQTEVPTGDPTDVQIDRVTRWLGTYLVNDATWNGVGARGGRFKRWVDMNDSNVRETHRLADGQIRPIDETFDVGGYELRFPGDPVGPPEVWINCRCILQPAATRGEANVSPTTFALEDPEDIAVEVPDDEDLPTDDLEDDEEEITEVPVHGVLAPEGVPTGDGRQFGIGSLTNRDLPLPIAYQLMSSEGHMNSVTVGRIDEIERVGSDMRFRGMLVLTKAHTNEVIEGIIDGTVRGISVDVDDVELEMSEDPEEALEQMMGGGVTVFSKARIAGVTIVPIPAFQEAFISLGHEFADEMSDEDREALAACGCEMGGEPGAVIDGQIEDDNPDIELGYDVFEEESVAAAAFAPGTKDGDVGTLISWSVLSTDAVTKSSAEAGASGITAAGSGTAILSTRGVATGRLIYSTLDPMTMSAGSGPDIGTGLGMAASPSPLASASPRTASSTSAASARSLTDSFSTISAGTAGASTPGILNPSPTPKTSVAETRDTEALVASAGMASTKSPILMRGTSGLSMEFSDGRVVPVTSMDASSGIVRLSDGIALAAGRALFLSNPSTRDGPGWITHPVPTSRIRLYWTKGKGAGKIRWGAPGDFNRCRRQLAKYIANPEWLAGACANMHKEALGIWPSQHRGKLAITASAQRAPIFNLVAGATKVYDSRMFARPEGLTGHEGVIVDADLVYGYVATWKTCHIGITGICTAPPYTATDYSYFATGIVDTDEGPVHVGQITMDTGHASLRSNAKIAAAHYDNTGAAVADVAIGEDAIGIWFSGVMRSTATDEQRHALRASGRLSGDWREIGGNLELVAALAVNVPGFPIPHALAASANGHQTALVAAGMVDPHDSPNPAVTASGQFDAEKVAAIVRTAVDEYRHAEKREKRVAPLRESLRAKRVAALRSKIGEK